MVVSSRASTLTAVVLFALAGCTSSSNDDEGTAGSGFLNTQGELDVAFPVAYSAFDGVHMFQLPAIVRTPIQAKIIWSISPAGIADLEPDATGGVMLTMRGAGDATLTATAGKLVGHSMLHVTAATPDQWDAGNMRYHNDVKIDLTMRPPEDAGMPMGRPMIDIPTDAACVNCHGEGASMLHIEHSPEQIGGFSDDDLKAIFKTGMKPVGSPFISMIPPFFYKMFHTWATADDAQSQALVVYLRSLTPKSQGMIDYPRPPGR